jgi:hypothetical protein
MSFLPAPSPSPGDVDAGTAAAIASLLSLADSTIPFAIRAAGTLGVADHLAAGPMGVDDLALATGTHAASLRRLLVALASCGIFEEVGPDRFGLAPPGELLQSDHPISLRDAYRLSALEAGAWGELVHSLSTGTAAFEHAYGVGHRRYRGEHPEEDERMDRAHRAATRLDVLTVVRAYEWPRAGTVVDVGGGTGALVAGLLGRFKSMQAVLFDLPRMVARAGEVLEPAGVGRRCRVVGGDFFVAVPEGGDVYVLKAVLGGWDDAAAGRILGTIRRAMGPASRLLVIEPILDYGAAFTVGNVVHLQSLVLYGGPDRTREDYERLFASSGLALTRVVPRATLPIIEAAPV